MIILVDTIPGLGKSHVFSDKGQIAGYHLESYDKASEEECDKGGFFRHVDNIDVIHEVDWILPGGNYLELEEMNLLTEALLRRAVRFRNNAQNLVLIGYPYLSSDNYKGEEVITCSLTNYGLSHALDENDVDFDLRQRIRDNRRQYFEEQSAWLDINSYLEEFINFGSDDDIPFSDLLLLSIEQKDKVKS